VVSRRSRQRLAHLGLWYRVTVGNGSNLTAAEPSHLHEHAAWHLFEHRQSVDARELAARANLQLSAARRLQGETSTLRLALRAKLCGLAADIAREHLRQWGTPPPLETLNCCEDYLEVRKQRMPDRRCSQCDASLQGKRGRYCCVACKQRAYRQRRTVARHRVLVTPSRIAS
jgi:hypothetical protein